MYYSSDVANYNQSVWRFVLGGGRINYHPLYPSKKRSKLRNELLQGNLMRAESRIRLLNYISQSPLDCPVAVIFGHWSAMNWAGPAYNDVGMTVADQLWRRGFPADLIPSSEIDNNSLSIDKEGWICYGPQRYKAVVLYHPEFEKESTAVFFDKAAKGLSKLYRLGNWTRNFKGQRFDGHAALPEKMLGFSNPESVIEIICDYLDSKNIKAQSAATDSLTGFDHISSAPPTSGFCRLIDGTIIQIAGTKSVAGDPILSDTMISNSKLRIDAIGVVAIRSDELAKLRAMAAGGLKYFKFGDFEISLDKRVDLALWKNETGTYSGLIQDWDAAAVPAALLTITKDWKRLEVPVPLRD